MSAANMMHSAQGAVSSGGNKMLKLIWGKANQPTAERVKIQKELFQFQKVRAQQRSSLSLSVSLASGLVIFAFLAYYSPYPYPSRFRASRESGKLCQVAHPR